MPGRRKRKRESQPQTNKDRSRDGWTDSRSFISRVPAAQACLLVWQWPERRHQAHSKSRPNYGQMKGRSLCLRTKPEVTQLVFKGSSHSRGWGGGGGGGMGGSGWGRWPAGYKYLFGQLLERKFAVCLSSTHPGGGPGGCKTSELEGGWGGSTCLSLTARNEEFD